MRAEPVKYVYNSLELAVSNTYSEIELITAARRGDHSAFKKIFEEHVQRIYAFCLRLSAVRQFAEELTQDVFVKAWENLHQFRGESKFTTWLHSIAVNEFLMQKRSEKRLLKKLITSDDLTPYERADGKTDTHHGLNIDLEKAISSLPGQAKAVFILHDIEGYKHNEISKMIKIQEGTSKAHLHRARKILREELSK
ncbi:MAG: RNA polymerase sigma factor [Ignavibacteria bacterium]|jgi:RNA polymerase sigma-70 factor (ECF subfamily)